MPAKFTIFTVAAIPFVLACGGDDDGGGNRIMVQPDASSGGVDAPTQANCTAASSYSGVVPPSGPNPTESAGTQMDQTTTLVYWTGLANMDPDILALELYSGFGAFSGG